MKSKLLKPLLKYSMLFILDSFLFAPWAQLFRILDHITWEELDQLQTLGDYLLRIVTVIFLLLDCKKAKVNYTLFVCLAGLFYPLLGVVLFALLFLEQQQKVHGNGQ